MPPPAVDCIACGKYYPLKDKRKGLLGTAPHKYCYRKKCRDEGIAKGYVKSLDSNKRPAGGPSSDGLPAPAPERMEREDAPVFAKFKVAEIHALYGFRCVSRATLPACRLTLTMCFVLPRLMRSGR